MESYISNILYVELLWFFNKKKKKKRGPIFLIYQPFNLSWNDPDLTIIDYNIQDKFNVLSISLSFTSFTYLACNSTRIDPLEQWHIDYVCCMNLTQWPLMRYQRLLNKCDCLGKYLISKYRSFVRFWNIIKQFLSH